MYIYIVYVITVHSFYGCMPTIYLHYKVRFNIIAISNTALFFYLFFQVFNRPLEKSEQSNNKNLTPGGIRACNH